MAEGCQWSCSCSLACRDDCAVKCCCRDDRRIVNRGDVEEVGCGFVVAHARRVSVTWLSDRAGAES